MQSCTNVVFLEDEENKPTGFSESFNFGTTLSVQPAPGPGLQQIHVNSSAHLSRSLWLYLVSYSSIRGPQCDLVFSLPHTKYWKWRLDLRLQATLNIVQLRELRLGRDRH